MYNINIINENFQQRTSYENNLIFHLELKKALDLTHEYDSDEETNLNNFSKKKRKLTKVID